MATYNFKVKLDDGNAGIGAGVVLLDKDGKNVKDSAGNIIGAVADENGDVTLEDKGTTGTQLKITYIGFEPQTVGVATATVTLKTTTTKFNDVTVMGCGGKFKKFDTKTGKCAKDWNAFASFYWWAIAAIILLVIAAVYYFKTRKK